MVEKIDVLVDPNKTNGPFHLDLYVFDEEGNWKHLQSYCRAYIDKKISHNFFCIFKWCTTKRYFTETREGFISRCINYAMQFKSQHNNRAMKLQSSNCDLPHSGKTIVWEG